MGSRQLGSPLPRRGRHGGVFKKHHGKYQRIPGSEWAFYCVDSYCFAVKVQLRMADAGSVDNGVRD